MKKLLLVLLLSSSLFSSSSIYTLDNIKNLNIYFTSSAGFITKEKKEELHRLIKEKLLKAGFIFDQTDAQLFVVRIDAIEVDGTYVVNIQVGVSEEVVTKRTDDIETYAYTYQSNKFMEAFEPYADTSEALSALVEKFIEAYMDDNEE